ncbi:nuclear transport factor 2 family protein [Nocardioides sp. TRM66260-LWL]|uniref:nuclear transport factor 2 family protein n=1 Tax=Nocardioides sp. TRM66260-LWL TaxID=2874478 RepID=UPI001CC41B33|nr:nuclear transport factor 2 family protein [Nocardioides sp. TRM66260-LWL]MBZ5734563.1 nuclear transport factor 2 family protein [Nocardioides sp. TRM66260-LWL]
MPASEEQIRAVVERYVALVATGPSSEIAALYAEDATLEDPVGSDALHGREAIRAFYATLDDLEQTTRLIESRITAGQAAFLFEVATHTPDATLVLAPIDVMTFDDDARITSMRAFWGPGDLRTT